MNFLLKSLGFSNKPLFNFKFRNLCSLINFPQHYHSTDTIQSHMKREIEITFIKEQMSSDKIYELFQQVTQKVNFNCNHLTKIIFESIWNEIHKHNIEVDINHVNFTMEAYLWNDIEFNPLDIVKIINKYKLSSNNITYELLLKKYCKMGNFELAMKLVDKMAFLAIPLNSSRYAWLIGCAIRAKKPDEIDRLYAEMTLKNLSFTSLAYGFIAESYANVLDVSNCIRLLKQSESIQDDKNKTLKSKFSAFYELAKNNGTNEQLLQLLDYKKDQHTIKEIIPTYRNLLKTRQFAAANVLIQNAGVEFEEFHFKMFAKWLVILRPPYPYMKYMLSKITDVQFDKFLIKHLFPMEEAMKVLESHLKGGVLNSKILMNNLLINANSYPNPVPKLKFALGFFRNKYSEIDYHSGLIDNGIGQLLSVNPELTYDDIIATYSFTKDNYHMIRFICCCIFHALVKGNLSEARRLLDKHHYTKNFYFKFSFGTLAYLIVKTNSIEEIRQSAMLIKAMILPRIYQEVLISIIKQITIIHSSEDLVDFIGSFKDDVLWGAIDMMKNHSKITPEKLELLNQLRSKYETVQQDQMEM